MSLFLFAAFSDTLRPGDLLEISVLGQEYSERVAVDEDGFAYLSLVGPVKASGLTVSEFADTLSARLEPYYKDAKVIVRFLNLKAPSVTVSGAVASPGVVAYQRGMTLLDLLREAGWLKPEADPKGIVLVRKGRGERVGLKPVSLAPGDVVIVPERSSCLTWENLSRAATLINLTVSLISLYIILTNL